MRRSLLVLSNRQPFRHDHVTRPTTTQAIEVSRPVSGLVSATEAFVRQHQGVWIAQACGNADFEVLDPNGEILAPYPPPNYRLRRVFLTQNEKAGHTDGFSNRALWPLCHLSYQRPQFSAPDWLHYQSVNQQFANSVRCDELHDGSRILIQDFHLALVPRLIRDRFESHQGLARPKIAIFWHIPWPPAEIFLRCPWGPAILEGILGADLIGFHIPDYCENFIATCKKALGTSSLNDESLLTRDGRRVRVRSLPVAIEPESFESIDWDNRHAFIQQRLGIHSNQLILAVDRIDHTKGILERLHAYSRLLQRYPHLRGRVTLLQIAIPCRMELPEYGALHRLLQQSAEQLNESYGAPSCPAIQLITEAQPWQSLSQLYQVADVCIASPIHDGMNLVAKEYIWCQHHENGALILSRFAGAYAELGHTCWGVNPHDTDHFADTIAEALLTSIPERRRRMQRLRNVVLKRKVSDWGNELLQELEAS
jgi:trehalose 6-phosphate synthase